MLLAHDRRPADRSRFVAPMRTANLIAGWRREGVIVEDQTDRLYTHPGAIAGLASLDQLPTSTSTPEEIREAKALIEATGMLFELPILETDELPAVTPSISVVIEGEMTVRSGSDLLGAFHLICRDHAEHGIHIPVWIIGREFRDPPAGLLFWPWVENLMGARR